MPIYEFHCSDCETLFETLVRAGHDEDAECPSCHSGDHLSRELSVFASARSGESKSVGSAPPMRGGGGGCCGGGGHSH
ncbi:MAG TPA: zinc ribbon domain-containing protein [Candidatus Binataceae bacterium]|nr:zinc ribbon domain-containing protein [Candidatus Binataceae bacterium]